MRAGDALSPEFQSFFELFRQGRCYHFLDGAIKSDIDKTKITAISKGYEVSEVPSHLFEKNWR